MAHIRFSAGSPSVRTTTAGVPPPGRSTPTRAGPRTVAVARRCTEIGLFAFAMLLVLRTWLLEGLVTPIRVAGPSMAETLKGPHCRIRCSDCGFDFAVGANQLREDRSARCPNCRFLIPDVGPLEVRPGDRLLIDKLTLALRPPRRWEVVVFRCPRRASQYCIKRIVGLPGETVQIVKGEVLVNGRRVRKSLSQFRKMAILVHDTRFRHGAQRQRPWPWQAAGETGWRSTGAGFRYVPDASRQTPEKTRQVEWLEFQYRSGSPAKPPDAGPILVSDDYGYNQSLSRPLQEVNDLLLVCRVKVSGAGELYLRAATADRLFEARLQPAAGSGQLYADGNLVDQLVDREPFLGGPQLLEWTTIDGTCRLVVDGRLLLGYTPAERAGDARRRGTIAVATGKTAEPVAVSSLWPLGIGAVNVEVETANLQVYRDVYYTKLRTAAGRDRVTAVQLGDDEYFVLGDNSPVSLDSRQVGKGSLVPADWLLGRPLIRP